MQIEPALEKGTWTQNKHSLQLLGWLLLAGFLIYRWFVKASPFAGNESDYGVHLSIGQEILRFEYLPYNGIVGAHILARLLALIFGSVVQAMGIVADLSVLLFAAVAFYLHPPKFFLFHCSAFLLLLLLLVLPVVGGMENAGYYGQLSAFGHYFIALYLFSKADLAKAQIFQWTIWLGLVSLAFATTSYPDGFMWFALPALFSVAKLLPKPLTLLSCLLVLAGSVFLFVKQYGLAGVPGGGSDYEIFTVLLSVILLFQLATQAPNRTQKVLAWLIFTFCLVTFIQFVCFEKPTSIYKIAGCLSYLGAGLYCLSRTPQCAFFDVNCQSKKKLAILFFAAMGLFLFISGLQTLLSGLSAGFGSSLYYARKNHYWAPFLIPFSGLVSYWIGTKKQIHFLNSLCLTVLFMFYFGFSNKHSPSFLRVNLETMRKPKTSFDTSDEKCALEINRLALHSGCSVLLVLPGEQKKGVGMTQGQHLARSVGYNAFAWQVNTEENDRFLTYQGRTLFPLQEIFKLAFEQAENYSHALDLAILQIQKKSVSEKCLVVREDEKNRFKDFKKVCSNLQRTSLVFAKIP